MLRMLSCVAVLAALAFSQAPANDLCSNAFPLFAGETYGDLRNATPTAAGGMGCSTGFGSTRPDVWYVFNSPTACQLSVTGFGGGFTTRLAIYTGTCGTMTSVSCGTSGGTVSTFASANTNYFVRVVSTNSSLGNFKLDTYCTLPVGNDDCSTATPVFDGTNPGAPHGTSGYVYTNSGATSSATFADTCGGSGHPGSFDVFFVYVATCNAVTVETCVPKGFLSGTLGDTMLSIYDISTCATASHTALDCNDDDNLDCTPKASRVSIHTIVGHAYLIRVSSYATNQTGSFYLTVHAAGTFPTGPGCHGISGATPTLAGTTPIMGQDATVLISGFAPNAPGVLFVSNCAGTPIDIGSGCSLYLDPNSPVFQALVPFVTNGNGEATFSGTVPQIPEFQCKNVCAQAVVVPAGGNPAYQLSNGLALFFGP